MPNNLGSWQLLVVPYPQVVQQQPAISETNVVGLVKRVTKV